MGWAMPLSGAVLLGIVLGYLAPVALFELWALALLLVWRWRGVRLLVMAMLLPMVSILASSGAVLPQGLSREDLSIVGVVTQVDSEGDGMSRLHLDIAECAPLAVRRMPCDGLRHVRLSVFGYETFRVGEHWALTVRLRPPAGFSNPDTFDFQRWLWREGIDATGYVRQEPAPRRVEQAAVSLRDSALKLLDARLPDGTSRRWLAALTLGAGERLNDVDWALLNASGTTHLVVISGLHVGLVAAFALLAGRGLARLTMPGTWRLVTWPWWFAAMVTVGYALLSGFGPPAQRAMIMTLVGLWVASGRHAPGPWQAWWLALALVLLVDPLSLWRPGLWLSFVAVALLIVIWQGRTKPGGIKGWWWALLRTQLLLAPLMAGAVLLAFDRLAPAAPLVNLIAVPLVSLMMVPLGLLGWLFVWLPPLSALCWWLFAALVEALYGLLKYSVEWLPLWSPEPWQVWPLALALALLALLWALPALAVSLRVAGSLVLAVLPFSLPAPELPHGMVQVRVHDVGQGQLVDLRTAQHRLLYDTGPRFRSGSMPLESLWRTPQRFDKVVVSHVDTDHAGGVPVLAEHRVERFLAPRGEQVGVPFDACQAGEGWHWDGVEFRFLWPPAGSDNDEWFSNDRSCVLLVEAGTQRILITGDVGRQVERRFLLAIEPPVNLLVAGHHGSRTSTGPQLVDMLKPHHVIFSAGRDNAYGHPHDEVVQRLRDPLRCLWSTALDGAVTWRLGSDEAPHVKAERSSTWRRCRSPLP
ncbi:DNA internalization-related competence protein ComEC/Rec2 [Vreelandella populi]